MDVAMDVQKAVAESHRRGTLSGFGAVVLWLHYFQNLPLTEIARTFDVSERTVRRHHRAALQALRATGLLDAYEEPHNTGD